MKSELTQARLKELLDYDQETGVFTWKVTRGPARAGATAGCDDGRGYLQIGINDRLYRCHRLVWLYMTGSWPANQVDHINSIKSDNRWRNLREATHADNMHNYPTLKNNTSGFKGVCWHKSSKKWQARITVNGHAKHIGLFQTPDAAHAAYCDAAKRLYGEFANFGAGNDNRAIVLSTIAA